MAAATVILSPKTRPLIPVNSYGASKVASEASCMPTLAESGVDGIALRIFQAFGPFRRTDAVSARWLKLPEWKGRNHRISRRCAVPIHLYRRTSWRALFAALYAEPTPQRVTNVSGGTSLTLAEVAISPLGFFPTSPYNSVLILQSRV